MYKKRNVLYLKELLKMLMFMVLINKVKYFINNNLL